MAGLVPATHVLVALSKTWMLGIADKFTQSAQGRLLWPSMTIMLASCLVQMQYVWREHAKGGDHDTRQRQQP
jgi:hypothetical protein